MKKLSINIPTYNRSEFLVKNLNILFAQLREEDLINQVEINISDNASTDETKPLVEKILDANSDISISYQCNERNLGPDLNFIAAMQMARGEYSILFGDDDYFIEDKIARILRVLDEYPEADIITSNRKEITSAGVLLGEAHFIREEIGTRIFDFSDTDQARSYFGVSKENYTGGCLSFISSVIYKTKVLKEVGEYNDEFTGTCYSFLYYWWTYLLRGNKLLYLNESYCLCTTVGVTNNNYGKSLRRLMVDLVGLRIVADKCFTEQHKELKSDFLRVVKNCNQFDKMTYSYMMSEKGDQKDLLKAMNECGYNEKYIESLKTIHSIRYYLYGIITYILPYCITSRLHRS